MHFEKTNSSACKQESASDLIKIKTNVNKSGLFGPHYYLTLEEDQ